jgi:hypothetical protein
MKKMVGESKPFSVCWPPSNTSAGVRKEFQQFTAIEPVAAFFVNPFTCQIDVTETSAYIGRHIQERAEELELEILDLQNDVVLKSYASNENFWNLVDREKFPSLKSAANKIKSYYGSTSANHCFQP